MANNANVQAVLSALDVFSRAPEKAALEQANTWLQDFQHSSEAWSTCNFLLLSPDAPPAAKLFAAQTFRAKVTYDLGEMSNDDLFRLRDTLLTALQTYHAGPRTILVQLCLAISALALQFPAWEDPLETMIQSFGKNPTYIPAMLQFLIILPEEVTSNTKIPITDDEYKERAAKLLTANALKVIELLSAYLQAPGVTFAVQAQVFNALSSWLASGEIIAMSLLNSPLLAYTFQALASDDLFDSAVSAVCDLIHETQEVEDNMPVIEVIVPEVIALKPKLAEYKDDPEKIRGLARIFAEAGEAYRSLLLHHPETFFPIVEAIGECSAYPDLDIVPITFSFWMRLAQSIGKKSSVSPLFLDAYRALMGVIIRHLHFPADITSLTGQEAENFRSFRHVMGDTLKDCCYVLGTDKCLIAAYELITNGLSRGPNISWQEVEAPLFAMRSMGAEVDPNDDQAVPKIMDLIPSLPAHPRVRYAALLIISRYTEWINKHPDYIPYQLQYISAGFEDSDQEVNAAAGQALKYLCQDCKRHLVEFLPTLHSFLATMGSKLVQDDKVQVYEAIAYVISAMPMEQAAVSLRTFSLDILARVHNMTTKTTPVTKDEIVNIANDLENLEVMMTVIQSFGEQLPAACQNTHQEAWAVFEPFLVKYGSEYPVCERTTRVLRQGLNFFGSAVLPIVPSVLTRMAALFESYGFSSYLWMAGKLIGRFGDEEDPRVRSAFKEVYERSSNKLVAILNEKSPQVIPDVLEDYLQMLLQMIEFTPDVFFPSPAFPIAFRVAMASLVLVHSDIVFAALDLLRTILTHDSLAPTTTPPPPKFLIYAAAIKPVVEREGAELTGYLLSGIVGDFPEESIPMVVTIFRALGSIWPHQLLAWLPPIVQALPSASVSDAVKTTFVTDINSGVQLGKYEEVKYAIRTLHRASRKARERRRAGPLEG
ncbi:ARM repeat-containing protein [Dichomitus squalens LYAD-421 SS1]|uniref:ARM repeat-containing protein n=1 Tax=Dichomitus squalens (strain LYAD-421) TaxID=732165 RepID=UPI0004410EC9|nr:ARM repeat-containing protein [Dichomitus squalens LYAD-421 SS1]EJF66951.1 ARM repeat-containing protein [Dichomitus squalens LYAD-421 SS1]